MFIEQVKAHEIVLQEEENRVTVIAREEVL